jgi:hypothetical protein
MSVDLTVYLRRSAMPTPSAWQDAITASGLPVELDTDFDPDTFSGFLPCMIRGAASGFEYFADELSADDAAELEAPKGSDFSVTLVTHSDLKEFACSAVAAGVLAKVSGGLLFDPQSGDSIPADEALAWSTEQLAAAERE